MGTYLIQGAQASPRPACDACAARSQAKLSRPSATIRNYGLTGDNYLLNLTVELPGIIRSAFPLLVIADLICYEYILLQLPSAARHITVAPARVSVVWVSLPPAMLIALAVTGCLPSLALCCARFALDRRERSLEHKFRDEIANTTDGGLTRLLPPQNWVLFRGDAAYLLLAVGLIFSLHSLFWAIWLRQTQIFMALILPCALLLVLALAISLARDSAVEKVQPFADPYTARRLAQAQLAHRISYFFAFPLAFYAIISIVQAICYALVVAKIPASAPVVSANGNVRAFSNAIITNVGNPGIAQQPQLDRSLDSLVAPRSLIVALIGMVIVAIVAYVVVVWHSGLFRIWWAAEGRPTEATRLVTLERAQLSRLKRGVILQWALDTLTTLPGVAVIVIVGLWAARIYLSGPVLEDWIRTPMSAVSWYDNSVSAILGHPWGSIVSYLLLLLLISPGAVWLITWLYFLADWACRSAWLLLATPPVPRRVRDLVQDLLAGQGVAHPVIRVEGPLENPYTEPVLPLSRFCVIHLPAWYAEKLPDDQLRAVIAHELVHVKKHAWKLWWLGALSRIAVAGPGLLTLLLDYRSMELTADREAVLWTGDRDALMGALRNASRAPSLVRVPLESAETRPDSVAAKRNASHPAIRWRDAWDTTRSRIHDVRAEWFGISAINWGEETIPVDDRIGRIAGYPVS
jgi:beta-lactamase regulating signal transducer with metallopeptidase domain